MNIPASFSGPHTYNTVGTFVVTVTATDLALNTFQVTQTVTVTPNLPPTCTLTVTPPSGSAPLPVTATGSCTDPDGDTLNEVLDWGDHTTSPGPSGTHTYNKADNYKVTLTATDPANLTGSATQNVSVSRNQTPTCTLTVVPTSGPAPLPVSATAICSDKDDDPLTTLLSWGDGATTNSATGTHTYTNSGNFTVTVTATDPVGNVGTASQPVSVATTTPVCSVLVSPTAGNAPLAVSAQATCSDAGNDLSSVVTDFGDGFYQMGNNPTHTYVSGGSYTVTVVAHDKAGNASQPVTQKLTVSDDPALFVGIGGGQVAAFSRSGSHQTTLNSNQGGSMTGMNFDAVNNLYSTNFTADTVSRFNGSNTLMGTFGSGYNCKPESIVFDQSGNAYVGETGCSHAILKFDAYGNLEAAYSVATEQEGSDWIDLAADQCTIFYTSQGSSVLRYNACSKQQMPAFATGLSTGLGVKILPDGSVLVADKQDVVRFDSGGRKIMTYNASGENCFVSVTLDSDNASFWAADYCSSDVVEFNINSGNEVAKFNSGTAANTVYGISERIDPPRVTPAGALTPTPAQASVSGGQAATFTLGFNPNGAAASQTFTFSCAGLPANSSCSFSPASVQAGSGPVSTQLTLSTAGATAKLSSPGKPSAWLLALSFPWFGVVLAVFGGERNRRRARLLLLGLLLACLIPLLSCSGASGGSSSSPPPPSNPAAPPTPGSTTPSGTYTVVIHATSTGGAQSSTAVTLTVQ
ncbi:MAG TPA: PKD domain-containing protein [Terriglobales bacterium]|nr:PKD domain-containing protein [Terriglobales bacterium]